MHVRITQMDGKLPNLVYPMVYDRKRTDLLSFQRWMLTGLYRIVKCDEYRRSTKSADSVAAYRRAIMAS